MEDVLTVAFDASAQGKWRQESVQAGGRRFKASSVHGSHSHMAKLTGKSFCEVWTTPKGSSPGPGGITCEHFRVVGRGCHVRFVVGSSFQFGAGETLVEIATASKP